MAGQVKVTLVKSMHGQLANIAASARTVKDTPENRGMINTATHLLKVEKAG